MKRGSAIRGLWENPLYRYERPRRRGVRRRLWILVALGVAATEAMVLCRVPAAAVKWAEDSSPPVYVVIPFLAILIGTRLLPVLLGALAAAVASVGMAADARAGRSEMLLLTALTAEELALPRLLPRLEEGALLLAALLPPLACVWPFGFCVEEGFWCGTADLWAMAVGAMIGLVIGSRGGRRVRSAASAIGVAAGVQLLLLFGCVAAGKPDFTIYGATTVDRLGEVAGNLLEKALVPGVMFYLWLILTNVLLAGLLWIWLLQRLRGPAPWRCRARRAGAFAAVALTAALLFAAAAPSLHAALFRGWHNRPFEAPAWMSSPSDGIPARWEETEAAVVDDLLAHHLPAGMRVRDVEELLGSGSSFRPGTTSHGPLLRDPSLEQQVEAWLRWRTLDPYLFLEFRNGRLVRAEVR
ncbi:MAG: hypothetical protein HY321_06290 [Armatimonadetes bacterium]|nr:hypothetical protein [Armatimonadota bacterium]